jgi:hypothetical protein
MSRICPAYALMTNRRDAEGGDGGKQAIAEHGADAGGEAGPKAAGDGALNDENIDRLGRGHAHADAGSRIARSARARTARLGLRYCLA